MLNNAFNDVLCHVAKIMTHIQNMGHCVGPHSSSRRTMRDQPNNKHKEPHQDRKMEEALKLRAKTQEE